MSKDDIQHGFGVSNAIAPHRFLVRIPKDRGSAVEILEDFGAAGMDSGLGIICRVRIPRANWRAVADEAKAYLNRRLREKGLKSASFHTGDTPVERLLGRELTVLGWAIEAISPEEAAASVTKWASYRAEELWWLFNQIDRDAGEFDDARTGWRRGVAHIFAPAQAPALEKRKKRRSADGSPHHDHGADLFSYNREGAL